MNVLITNDDGIAAEGLASLQRAVEDFFPEATIFTAAPAEAMSLVGHRVTTHSGIRVDRKGDRSWAVHGTPADCVRMALTVLLPSPPDWVLSGINHGGNMGHDIYISGTVAAVREAAFLGVRGMAFSHYLRRGHTPDWKAASSRTAGVIGELVDGDLKPGEFWNINLPHLPDGETEPSFKHTHPERAPLHVSFEEREGAYHYNGIYGDRPRQPGSDVDVCFGGQISISRLSI